jgi:aminoglycoside phosphotransferase (APT) family kinase protein
MTAELEARALAAARAVAAAHGLDPAGAAVVHAGSNVVVHLRPAPVVARVMTGTVALHDDPATWLRRETAVLAFLAPSGLAVAPSATIDPGPHEHDGVWVTCTTWIPGAEPAATPDDPRRLGRALRDLHDALAPFDGDLADLGDLRDDIRRLHARLRPAEDDDAEALPALRARLDALEESVFASPLPAQALHGDVSLSNLLRTPGGLVWNDFEDTFRGPVQWDVASFAVSLRGRGADEAFVRAALDAYGWGDPADLAPWIAAHDVYGDIWQRYDRGRRTTGAG